LPPRSTAPPVARSLTLETIVDAASDLVAAEGFDALTMRRLAQRCGVGAMTLYGYVRTKEELLGALANRLLSELELPGDDSPWEEQIAHVFRSVREVFLQHPELIPIAATQRIDGAAAYRGAEVVFRALRNAGLDDRTMISAFDALTSFTIGSAQRETGLTARSAESLPGIRELEADRFENVIMLAGLLVTRDPENDFEVGLKLLILGIATWAKSR
jgi:AcrR family transcriptional regulator